LETLTLDAMRGRPFSESKSIHATRTRAEAMRSAESVERLLRASVYRNITVTRMKDVDPNVCLTRTAPAIWLASINTVEIPVQEVVPPMPNVK